MSPLLRKGGVHQQAKSGARADAKRQMQKAAEDWRDEPDEKDLLTLEAYSRNESGNEFHLCLR